MAHYPTPSFARTPRSTIPLKANPSKSKMVSSHPNTSTPTHPPLQTKSNSPTDPATPPSNVPTARLLTAPDFGAAVLLALGAGADDDELEDGGAEELEEEAAELADVEVVSVVEVVEVTMPPEGVVALVMTATGGVGEDVVSLVISFGTEAVETNGSVAAETAPLAAEDAPRTALEAAAEAVDSALWTAAEAWVSGTMGMGRCVGTLAAAVLASTAALEATLTATVELATTPPATFDATAPSSDAADWALAPA